MTLKEPYYITDEIYNPLLSYEHCKGSPGLPTRMNSSALIKAIMGREDVPLLTRHTSANGWFSMTSMTVSSMVMVTDAAVNTKYCMKHNADELYIHCA